MDVSEVLAKLEAESNAADVEGMARFGIRSEKILGTRVPVLRKLAKEIGRDHELALQLWAAGYRETRILAALVDQPKRVTEEQVDAWVADFDNWEVCDQCCMNLFDKLPFAYDKAKALCTRTAELERRAGFALMACLAWHDKKATDAQLLDFLPCLERGATDGRTLVKKAVSWALRHIGKRNAALNAEAVAAAERIRNLDSKAARWVASDVLRELTSDKIRKRLAM